MTRIAKRTLFTLAAILLAAVIGVASFVYWCVFGSGYLLVAGPISDVQEYPSPDGMRKALLYRVYGSAWEVSILRAGKPLPQRWRRPIFTTDGDLSVSTRWTDRQHLLVVYGPIAGSDPGDAARRISSFDHVHIDYHYVP
jgi:hypothetical protein